MLKPYRMQVSICWLLVWMLSTALVLTWFNEMGRVGVSLFDGLLEAAPVTMLIILIAFFVARNENVFFLFLIALLLRWGMVAYFASDSLLMGGEGDRGADDTFWWAAANELENRFRAGTLTLSIFWEGLWVPTATPLHPEQVVTQVGFPFVLWIFKSLGAEKFISIPFINAAVDSMVLPLAWSILRKVAPETISRSMTLLVALLSLGLSDGIVHGAAAYRDSHIAVLMAINVLLALSRFPGRIFISVFFLVVLFYYRHVAIVLALIPYIFLSPPRFLNFSIRRLVKIFLMLLLFAILVMLLYPPVRENIIALAIGNAIPTTAGDVRDNGLTSMIVSLSGGPAGIFLLVAASVPVLLLRIPMNPGSDLLPLFFTGAVRYVLITPALMWALYSSIFIGGAREGWSALQHRFIVASLLCYVVGIAIFLPIAVLTGPRHLYFLASIEFVLTAIYLREIPRYAMRVWVVFAISHVLFVYFFKVAN